ncbi:MAG TPA: NAD(P)H-dependent oxidoreductase subunit E [Aggregatilineaceae bacterium]|nr:NAD(P)H-dependent oxidoreductase subunit E [Aggregatilineaceae bacterium]
MEEILQRYEGRGRDALLPILWDVQTAEGYIGPDAVHAISHLLHVPEADIYGVITFYTLFSDQPTDDMVVRVCTDPVCALEGADYLCHMLPAEATTCLGMCDHAPAVLVSRKGFGEKAYGRVYGVYNMLAHSQRFSHIGGDPLILLDGIHGSEAQSLVEYGDYEALRHALFNLTPDAVIQTVKDAGLIGRGGAAFPTAIKWAGARQAGLAAGVEPYLVGNGDESEPGTFKDSALMAQRPHLLIEGMLLCAYAIGATQGYLFIRGEYPEAQWRIDEALRETEAANLIGDHILGSDFSFQIEIRRGAGAYICGEETALFEAIEGKRGYPRIKPPYPTTAGLFGKPTVVNNIETLCAVPGIVQHGAVWFRQWGTEKSPGTKLVSVSGHVQKPGVYEITPGITLREVLDRFCGGLVGNLKAVLMGGAAGTFLTPDEIDVRLTFEDLRAIGGSFGSGAIVVFSDTVDLRDVMLRLARFFQHESCGKCFPCQLGTQRQMEILERSWTPYPGDRERLIDIGRTMTESSLCGLGQTAGSAVMSALAKWEELSR